MWGVVVRLSYIQDARCLKVNEERNILRTIKRRKADWIGHICRRNCRLKYSIEGRLEGTRRRGRRRSHLLGDIKETRGYWKQKQGALFLISGFRGEVPENCVLLNCNAACGGNFLAAFGDNLSVLHVVHSVRLYTSELWQHQHIHDCTICTFFLSLIFYNFYKSSGSLHQISLKHTAIISFTVHALGYAASGAVG